MPIKTVRKTLAKVLPGKVLPGIKAWSFTRLRDYELCPLKAKFKHVDKLKEPGNKAMDRGLRIHKECELWLKSKKKSMPKSMELFATDFRELRRISNLEVEQNWAFTTGWQEADWFDTTGNTWVRIKVDAAGIVKEKGKLVYRLIDYKTGKIRPEHEDQLDLYALAGFHRQGVDLVRGELWYLDQSGDNVIELEYAPEEVNGLDKKWRARANRMTKDQKFVAKPSHSNCLYCHFKKAKGGPCKF